MKFRSLSSTDGDWMFGSGRSSYAIDNNAVMLNIATTLRTFLGECFFNKLIGVDWFNLINLKNKDVVLLSLKSTIYSCFGVIEVTEMEYTLDINRQLVLKYRINTLYEKNVLGTVTV